MTAAVQVALAATLRALDERLGALPEPARRLPNAAAEAVFVRSLDIGRAGIGLRSVGPLPAQDDIRHGLLELEAEVVLWERDAVDLAQRARALIDSLLNLPNSPLPPAESSPGRIREARLVRGEAPVFGDGVRAWRQSLLLQVIADYRVVDVPTDGVIATVEVDLQGELAEDFSVGGGA